jgi:hypothetical protein
MVLNGENQKAAGASGNVVRPGSGVLINGMAPRKTNGALPGGYDLWYEQDWGSTGEKILTGER